MAIFSASRCRNVRKDHINAVLHTLVHDPSNLAQSVIAKPTVPIACDDDHVTRLHVLADRISPICCKTAAVTLAQRTVRVAEENVFATTSVA
jgi:hypothetical protein